MLKRGTESMFPFGIFIGIASIALGAFIGLLPGKALESMKLLKTYQTVCGIVLILFGFQLFYYVANVLM